MPQQAAGGRERVLLVSMPFGALERPSLALGLLQAHCHRLDVPCDTRYLNLALADDIGLADYLWVSSDVPYTAFAGEWLFADALYGPRPVGDSAYITEVLRAEWGLEADQVARLERIRARSVPFLDRCMAELDWGAYTFVGFTSVFQQNIASLALAQRVKEAHPSTTIAFGGANWEEAMGAALKGQFAFVDLVFSGEADESFPAVLRARREGRPVEAIPGLLAGPEHGPAASATRVEHLDDVPVPDFAPYFDQLRASPAACELTPTLLLETSRGCWWGERSHCTFCGLNGSTMAFRSKSPERVVAEISSMCRDYGAKVFSVVDDILDMRYFRSVLPMLADAALGADLFWEVKANLSPNQVRVLRDAGVRYIQPGVESLSDHVLGLMRKGTTALRNVELLKWCKEYGVKPMWNLLYGFPGETAEDYEDTLALINAIWHLDPPTGWGPVRLDRFSPYHEDPASFGMVDVRPMKAFTCLYPFDTPTVMQIAYYFDFDYADGRSDDSYIGNAIELARVWMADHDRGALTMTDTADGLVLVDTRRGVEGGPRRSPLSGWKAAVYRACDRAHSLAELAVIPEVEEAGASQDDVLDFLSRCRYYQLMVASGGRWLGLAVHQPARDGGGRYRPTKFLALQGTQTGEG